MQFLQIKYTLEMGPGYNFALIPNSVWSTRYSSCPELLVRKSLRSIQLSMKQELKDRVRIGKVTNSS